MVNSASGGGDDSEQQPLLSHADHDLEPHPEGQASISAPSPAASKDNREDWHWLEKLVFKTRLRFVVSVCLFFVFWTFVALTVSGEMPGNDIRWPWTKDPDYYGNMGFYNAMSRLHDQPFCLPDVGLLQPADVSSDETASLYRWRGFEASDSMSNNDTYPKISNSNAWHCMMHGFTNQQFDKLVGSTVKESTRRRRDSIQAVMSVAQGNPFYTRTASTAPSASESNDNFRSVALHQTMQLLSSSASQQTGKNVTLNQLIQGFNLSDTRLVTQSHQSSSSEHFALPVSPLLETTLLDTHKFAQSLLAIYHGIIPPSEALPLSPVMIHSHLSPSVLSTDGSTATTESLFDLVRGVVSRSGGPLAYIGRREYGAANGLQHSSRPLDLHTLNEIYGDHELSITLNLERGLVATALARLGSPQNNTLEKVDRKQLQQQADEANGDSLWNWLHLSVTDISYQLDRSLETRLRHKFSGTYRYEASHKKDDTRHESSADHFDWVEVDVQIDERVLWITRIEYAMAGTMGSSSSSGQVHFSTATNGTIEPVSVLKKYNVGGTADFLAGWTCQAEDKGFANCYRPLVGTDESKCTCHSWRQGTDTAYRVGLWPLPSSEGNLYRIPQAAIRLDGNSYMDQGIGGCPALWRPNYEEAVPEMLALGFELSFSEALYNTNGSIAREAELQWLKSGLTLSRVRQTQSEW
ncbi:uncharacterized protein UTRI_10280 [Ustilago trichophora]|uniref:Uncharacterized protein n=1 Tax=Ustilago trichophora TaxID=86804 RepID=A0A5C3EJB8_9BASI|nr:uncharacterized protein UTRI_10280 [Ustilago trichophora]